MQWQITLFAETSGTENILLLRTLMGIPSFEILETGLSVYFTEDWKRKGFQYWTQKIKCAGQRLTIRQLLEDRPEHSPLIKQALAASLVEFLMEEWGLPRFKQIYQEWNPSEKELNILDDRWIKRIGKGPDPEHEGDFTSKFMQGFNFTHEGYSIYNGYGSQLSVASLERLKAIHCNSVALVPYTGTQETDKPSLFHFSQRAGSETDEGIVHAILNAKKLGMTTMLKPHVWIRGGWPGDINMKSSGDWDQFFKNYGHWISHYALIAEIYQVDIFCIGVEFSQATLSGEDHWRHLIKSLRNIYSGPLTYAANWGDEFEKVEFWDQLDYIGLNCYYPISKQDEPDLKRLRQGVKMVFDKVDEVHQRFGKPVILTEIGFRSVQSPWKQPHERAGDKPYNQEHQAKAYQAVLEELPSHPGIRGVLWWKWPTIMENDSQFDRRFVPYDKTAEQMVGRYFKQYKYRFNP